MHDDAFLTNPASAKTLALRLLSGEPWVLIQVTQTQGSVPREAGTWMAASPQSVMGTIGGGHLEHQAIALAREGLRTGALKPEVKMTLGPSLGQCCGGVVVLGFERLHAHDAQSLSTRLQEPRRSVALFGGGMWVGLWWRRSHLCPIASIGLTAETKSFPILCPRRCTPSTHTRYKTAFGMYQPILQS